MFGYPLCKYCYLFILFKVVSGVFSLHFAQQKDRYRIDYVTADNTRVVYSVIHESQQCRRQTLVAYSKPIYSFCIYFFRTFAVFIHSCASFMISWYTRIFTNNISEYFPLCPPNNFTEKKNLETIENSKQKLKKKKAVNCESKVKKY